MIQRSIWKVEISLLLTSEWYFLHDLYTGCRFLFLNKVLQFSSGLFFLFILKVFKVLLEVCNPCEDQRQLLRGVFDHLYWLGFWTISDCSNPNHCIRNKWVSFGYIINSLITLIIMLSGLVYICACMSVSIWDNGSMVH